VVFEATNDRAGGTPDEPPQWRAGRTPIEIPEFRVADWMR